MSVHLVRAVVVAFLKGHHDTRVPSTSGRTKQDEAERKNIGSCEEKFESQFLAQKDRIYEKFPGMN